MTFKYRRLFVLLLGMLILAILLAIVSSNVDDYIVISLNQLRNNFLDAVLLAFSYSAAPITYTTAAVGFSLSLLRQFKPLRQKLHTLVAAVTISGTVPKLLKPIIARPRPFQLISAIHPLGPANGWSFPSGHTCDAFVLAAVTAIVLPDKKMLVSIVYLWAIIIGFSRIYLGVHFLSDVLAGVALSTASALLAHWMVNLNCQYNQLQ